MTGWNAEIAEWYAEKYGEYPTNRLAVDRLELAADAVVLDVGCGTGAALRRAAERLTSGRLIGVDPVPRMLEIARERAGDVTLDLREGSANALPLEDQSCDVVLAFDSMDHWDDVAEGLAEIRRVMRPGGRVLIVKDLGMPAATSVAQALDDAGFRVLEEYQVEEDAVHFAMWLAA
ncbi:MAG: class I SAM-dependent methyltransferase [Myxococcota bacterium]